MYTEPEARYVKRSTPWGTSETARTYGPGIIRYETPSHGGYILGKRRNAEIDSRWSIEEGIYEEDCDWSIVALTFPQYFSSDDVAIAHSTARRWHTVAYKSIYGDGD